jgi:hypothetical protein
MPTWQAHAARLRGVGEGVEAGGAGGRGVAPQVDGVAVGSDHRQEAAADRGDRHDHVAARRGEDGDVAAGGAGRRKVAGAVGHGVGGDAAGADGAAWARGAAGQPADVRRAGIGRVLDRRLRCGEAAGVVNRHGYSTGTLPSRSAEPSWPRKSWRARPAPRPMLLAEATRRELRAGTSCRLRLTRVRRSPAGRCRRSWRTPARPRRSRSGRGSRPSQGGRFGPRRS